MVGSSMPGSGISWPGSCVLTGRTHAGAQSLTEVIQRTRAYQDAGADAICLVGVKDFAHLESIAEGLQVPLMLVTYGNPRLQDDARLAELGVRIVVNGHAAYFAAIKATYDSLREQRGTLMSLLCGPLHNNCTTGTGYLNADGVACIRGCSVGRLRNDSG